MNLRPRVEFEYFEVTVITHFSHYAMGTPKRKIVSNNIYIYIYIYMEVNIGSESDNIVKKIINKVIHEEEFNVKQSQSFNISVLMSHNQD